MVDERSRRERFVVFASKYNTLYFFESTEQVFAPCVYSVSWIAAFTQFVKKGMEQQVINKFQYIYSFNFFISN